MRTANVILAFFGLLSLVSGYSTGAFDCLATLSNPHTPTTFVTTGVPYTFSFLSGGTAATAYTPAGTHTITISGASKFNGDEIWAQTAAGNTRVGTFTATGATRTDLSGCTGTTITHSQQLSVTSLTLTWTAPPAGTGPVTFTASMIGTSTQSTSYQITSASITEMKPPTSIGVTPPTVGSSAPPTSAVFQSSQVVAAQNGNTATAAATTGGLSAGATIGISVGAVFLGLCIFANFVPTIIARCRKEDPKPSIAQTIYRKSRQTFGGRHHNPPVRV